MSEEVATLEETRGSTPTDLLAIAVNADADIAKIEKLMELQERWDAKISKGSYYTSMSKFQATCPRIERSNRAHNNKYARLDTIVDTIKAALRDCGLTFRFEISDSDTGINVTCVITHVDGHSERTTMTAPADTSGNKNVIQSRASSVTYLQRYTLCAVLGLVANDEDNDGNELPGKNSQPTASELVENDTQVTTLIDLMAVDGVSNQQLSEMCIEKEWLKKGDRDFAHLSPDVLGGMIEPENWLKVRFKLVKHLKGIKTAMEVSGITTEKMDAYCEAKEFGTPWYDIDADILRQMLLPANWDQVAAKAATL